MKRTRIDCKGRTPEPVLPACLRSRLPALAQMERQIAHGYSPNVIEMMSILSEVVAFSTEGDTNQTAGELAGQFMSQKKCRFCD